MADIRVKLDQKDFKKDLDALQMKQYPFAFAKTLTDSAKLGQKAVQDVSRKVFRLHTEYIPRNIRITPARKGDVARGYGEAEVRTTEDIAFMTIQETGGIKRPRGAALAIPSFPALATTPDLRTGTGKIRAKYLPSRLVDKKGSFIKEAFLWIFRKAVGGIQPFFFFASSARIRPRWKFEPTVRKEVEKNAERLFAKNLSDAMGSAKP